MKLFQTAFLGLVAAAAMVSTTSAFSMSPSVRSAFSLRMSDTALDEAPVAAEEPTDPVEETSVEAPKHTVYMGNLPFSITPGDVSKLFAENGIAVQNIAMPVNPNVVDEMTGRSQSKGFCFVDVESEEMITSAVAALDSMDLEGRSIKVNKLLPKEQVQKEKKGRDRNFTPNGQKKMYVGNLPFTATEGDIRACFEEFGDIHDLYIPLRNGESRGFCFVTMDSDNTDKAIADLDGMEFMGRPLVVNEPLKAGEKVARPQRSKQFKLYVGNLSFYTTGETLQAVFEEFGEVFDCYLPTDPNTDQPRGFGFISMSQEAGEAAIQELDGMELDGRFIRVNEAQGKKRGPPPPRYNDNEGYNDNEDDVEDW